MSSYNGTGFIHCFESYTFKSSWLVSDHEEIMRTTLTNTVLAEVANSFTCQ